MINRMCSSSVDCASRASYQILSSTEFEGRLAAVTWEVNGTYALLDPFQISTRTTLALRSGYPAFQLDPRLNRSTFSKLRQLYKTSAVSEDYLWDFLRTVHKDLGGMTGIDYLLGFYTPEIAALHASEREEHFLDLASEDIWRTQQ